MSCYEIKLLVMDVDGTLTDGKIYMGNDGEVMKAFDVKDGYTIHYQLRSNGIIPVIITGRESQIVRNRCKELEIDYLYQGVSDKIGKLKELLRITGYSLKNVAYIGDDLNDIGCIEVIKKNGGLTGCPADAAKQVKDMVDYLSEYNGGSGAVRDFVEYIFKHQ